MTDKGVIYLTALTNLRYLNLSECNITDQAITSVTRVCLRLSTLKLRQCALLTHQSMRAASHLPELEELDMAQCVKVCLTFLKIHMI